MTFYETKTFNGAKKLTDRTEIATAFNLENRIALKLTLNADDYGDKGTVVKMSNGRGSYETLTLRRYDDTDEITLEGSSCACISSGFGLSTVKSLYENSNKVTVKNGDKVVILCEDKERGWVLTGHLELPEYKVGYMYTGKVVIDKADN